MRFELIDAVSDGVHDPIEDAWGYTDTAAWVMDGASAVDPRPFFAKDSDAAWMVGIACRQLREHLQVASNEPRLVGAVRAAALAIQEAMQQRKPTTAYTAPSAALTVGEIVGNALHVGGFADVTLVCESDGEIAVFENERGLRHELAALREHKSEEERQRLKERSRDRRRTAMNQPDGYWVLSDSPEAAEHMRETSIPVKIGSRVLLMSDGFARVVQIYKLYESWPELMAALETTALSSVLLRIREVEANDPERQKFVRSSVRDDATAALLRIRD
jgi:hypothetical protein